MDVPTSRAMASSLGSNGGASRPASAGSCMTDIRAQDLDSILLIELAPTTNARKRPRPSSLLRQVDAGQAGRGNWN